MALHISTNACTSCNRCDIVADQNKKSRFAVDECIRHLALASFGIAYTDNDYGYANGNRLGGRPSDGAPHMPTAPQVSRLVALPVNKNAGAFVGILSTAKTRTHTCVRAITRELAELFEVGTHQRGVHEATFREETSERSVR